jgi:hypothetical protein
MAYGICRQSFSEERSFTCHECSCQPSKNHLTGVLAMARQAWKERKRHQVDSESNASPTPIGVTLVSTIKRASLKSNLVKCILVSILMESLCFIYVVLQEMAQVQVAVPLANTLPETGVQDVDLSLAERRPCRSKKLPA